MYSVCKGLYKPITNGIFHHTFLARVAIVWKKVVHCTPLTPKINFRICGENGFRLFTGTRFDWREVSMKMLFVGNNGGNERDAMLLDVLIDRVARGVSISKAVQVIFYMKLVRIYRVCCHCTAPPPPPPPLFPRSSFPSWLLKHRFSVEIQWRYVFTHLQHVCATCSTYYRLVTTSPPPPSHPPSFSFTFPRVSLVLFYCFSLTNTLASKGFKHLSQIVLLANGVSLGAPGLRNG